MRIRHLLAAAAIAVPMLITVAAVAPAQAAQRPLLPLTVTNNSGRADKVFLYVVGVNLTTGRLGWVNAGGAFTPWPRGNVPPVPAPDVAFATKLKFFLTFDGLVQPAPWAPQDANHDILFDWSEFTYDGAGLFLNTSMVDMFSVPHAVAVTGSTGQTRRTGTLVAGGRNRIFDAVQAQAGFGKLIVKRSDGTRLRVLSPRKGLESGLFSTTYYDSYVSKVWNLYRTATLTVVPFENQPGTKYFGRVDGAGNLNFTNTSGARVASFAKPSTSDVFGCDGRLAAPNDLVVGPIARTLCAALHRSTLDTIRTQPSTDARRFYTQPVTDHYSRAMHANSVDGKAYGFAFDDVGHFESLVHDGAPRSAQITLLPF